MSNSYKQMMYRDGKWVHVGGPSGSGSNDYNQLTNTPIKNIAGSSREYFVNLSGLAYGHYCLTGFYKEDTSEDIKETSNPLDLIVVKDEKTGEKVILYTSVSNSELEQHILVYEGATLSEHIVKTPGQMYWED